MDSKQIELYLAANADKLPADQIANIKVALENADEVKTSKVQVLGLKSPSTILLFAIFLGAYGVDRFMLGETGLGVAKLLTCGGCGVWAIIDWFSAKNRARQYNYNKLQEALL